LTDGPRPGAEFDRDMPHATSDEARAAVTAALEARRARPALKVPVGAALVQPLNAETSSGLLIALLAWFASLAAYFGVRGGAVGWIVSSLCIVGTVVSLVKGWAVFPHDIRVALYHRRRLRVSKRWTKAMDLPEGDVQRVVAFRHAIVEGSLITAATGVVMLFRELAGEDAFAEEFIHERAPVWPARLYLGAFNAKHEGDEARARDFLEQALATEDPIWATAAAIGLLDHLTEPSDQERVAELTEWVLTSGDPAVATELLHYK
jgi:plasmid stability protein